MQEETGEGEAGEVVGGEVVDTTTGAGTEVVGTRELVFELVACACKCSVTVQHCMAHGIMRRYTSELHSCHVALHACVHMHGERRNQCHTHDRPAKCKPALGSGSRNSGHMLRPVCHERLCWPPQGLQDPLAHSSRL